MADNIDLNAGSGGSTLSTDEIGGVHYQRVKMNWGADGISNESTYTTPLPVASIDLGVAVAGGLISNYSAVNKFGHNPDIDTGTDPEHVWDGPTALWTAPTAARIHAIVSSDANDAAAGTGARTICVCGLDANFDDQQEVITLNGTTPVNTVNSYTRIFRMSVQTAGSTQINAGTITATAATDGTVTAQITAGRGQTLMAIYTVPRNTTAYMVNASLTLHRLGSTAASQAECSITETSNVDTATPAKKTRFITAVGAEGTNAIVFPFNPPKVFIGPCDIIWECNEVTDSNTKLSASFDLIEIASS